MIAVIDYGCGNLFSIGQALQTLNIKYSITDDPSVVAKAEKIILPGVGAFGDAMKRLRLSSMDVAILDAVADAKQILGICLGMQLLATRSDEFGDHEGLDLIRGHVGRLQLPSSGAEGHTRIPNMGWRRVVATNGCDLLNGIKDNPYFYFVHSYAMRCVDNEDIAGVISVNGENVTAIVSRDNVWGFQFHPEKSGPAGLKLLDRFIRS